MASLNISRWQKGARIHFKQGRTSMPIHRDVDSFSYDTQIIYIDATDGGEKIRNRCVGALPSPRCRGCRESYL